MTTSKINIKKGDLRVFGGWCRNELRGKCIFLQFIVEDICGNKGTAVFFKTAEEANAATRHFLETREYPNAA